MSFSHLISESVNSVMQQFISKISTQFNINKSELDNLWNNGVNTEIINKPQKVTSEPLDNAYLLRCNKDELTSLCKSRGFRYTGTKDILIKRLMGVPEEPKTKKTPSKNISVEDDDDDVKPKVSAKAKKVESTPVVKTLTANIPAIVIRKNKFNNLEHPASCLVFGSNKLVIGTQNEDGSIDKLTEEDIDKCNTYKFKYELPLDLDKKTSLADVNIEDLEDKKKSVVEDRDDDDIEVEDDIEEEEDEEEIEDEDN
jgi:hypothetical protein